MYLEALINESKQHRISWDGKAATLNDKPQEISVFEAGEGILEVLYKNRSYRIQLLDLNKEDKVVTLAINGKQATVSLKTEMDLLLKEMGLEGLAAKSADDIKAPMPGLIHSIKVEEGQSIEKGEPVLILEAMKMENVLKSASEGEIAKIHVQVGESVEKGQLLVSFVR